MNATRLYRGIPKFKDNGTVTEIFFILTRLLTWFFTLLEIEGRIEEPSSDSGNFDKVLCRKFCAGDYELRASSLGRLQ